MLAVPGGQPLEELSSQGFGVLGVEDSFAEQCAEVGDAVDLCLPWLKTRQTCTTQICVEFTGLDLAEEF